MFHICEAKFHGLLTELIEGFGFVHRHPRAVRFHQGFVLAPLNASPPLGIRRATRAKGTGTAMARLTAVAVHDIYLAVGLDAFVLSNPAQRVSFRTDINLPLSVPRELILGQ